ncbi:MAG TPA: outer membrane protein OmpK [Gemmatimonadaceae bacterium]|nr:outer membrane protein OmpK [Gemmatimonadaceae bacterium]
MIVTRATRTRIRRALGAAAVLLAITVPAAGAQSFSNWDAQLLYGADFEEPGNTQDVRKGIVTIENAAGWSWGSSFFFVDILHSDKRDGRAREVYGEWYPSASIGKLRGRPLSLGPVRDVSVTAGVNMGTKTNGAAPLVFLPGLTFDLKVPAFAFFTVGTYAYVDRGRFAGAPVNHGTSFQVTPSWSLPIVTPRVRFRFDGFLDYIGSHEGAAHQLLTQPQLKLDVGSLWDAPGRLYVGTEWQYWKNKFGVRGLTESFPQALVVLDF